MVDPEQDHGFVLTSDGRIDLDSSPFFDVAFGADQTVEDYVIRVVPILATEIDIGLGIHHRHPGVPLHPAYQALLDRQSESEIATASPIIEGRPTPPEEDPNQFQLRGLPTLILSVVIFIPLLAYYF